MKSIILFFFVLSIIPANGYAETKYVTEDLAVMVRTGPDNGRRIIAMPTSGTPVEVLEEQEDGWSRIRLSNDDEGWMLSRYLVSGPPSKELIQRLKGENARLTAQAKTLSTENNELKTERISLEKAYNEQKNLAESTNTAFETLKDESTEYLKVKAAYEEANKQLNKKIQEEKELDIMVQTLRKDKSLWWLIAGSSAVLLGFIIGYLSRRPKRTSYLR